VSEASGLAKISGEALGGARSAFDQAIAEAAGEQLPLLDDGEDLSASEAHLALPDAGEILSIQEAEGCGVAEAVTIWRNRGAKGRKPGARNRRSNDFSRWMLQFGPHPGAAMMRILARPAELLAAEMGCKKLEALDRQIRVAAELLPYFEGKKPVEVNLTGGGHMTLIMAGVAGLDGGEPIDHGAAPLEMSFAETVENQPLTDDAGGQSE